MFGSSVDINQNIAVVGSYADNTEGWRTGSVSIFSNNSNNWNLVNCIRPSYFTHDQFLIAIYPHYILVFLCQ